MRFTAKDTKIAKESQARFGLVPNSAVETLPLSAVASFATFAMKEVWTPARCWSLNQLGRRGTTCSSIITNCAGQVFDPQIMGTTPRICLRVIKPRVPHSGQERTAQ